MNKERRTTYISLATLVSILFLYWIKSGLLINGTYYDLRYIYRIALLAVFLFYIRRKRVKK